MRLGTHWMILLALMIFLVAHADDAVQRGAPQPFRHIVLPKELTNTGSPLAGLTQNAPEVQKDAAEKLQDAATKYLQPEFYDPFIKKYLRTHRVVRLFTIALSVTKDRATADDREVVRRWRVWWDSSNEKNRFDTRSDAERLLSYVVDRCCGLIGDTPERLRFEMDLIAAWGRRPVVEDR